MTDQNKHGHMHVYVHTYLRVRLPLQRRDDRALARAAQAQHQQGHIAPKRRRLQCRSCAHRRLLCHHCHRRLLAGPRLEERGHPLVQRRPHRQLLLPRLHRPRQHVPDQRAEDRGHPQRRIPLPFPLPFYALQPL